MAQQKGKMRIKNREDGSLVAVIADEDTVTGTLLAGVGQLDTSRRPNFLVVNSKTSQAQIEEAFKSFSKREDIGIILISQFIANDIRYLLDEYDQVVPTILEIPSKDHPYDSSKDSLMAKVRRMTGARD